MWPILKHLKHKGNDKTFNSYFFCQATPPVRSRTYHASYLRSSGPCFDVTLTAIPSRNYLLESRSFITRQRDTLLVMSQLMLLDPDTRVTSFALESTLPPVVPISHPWSKTFPAHLPSYVLFLTWGRLPGALGGLSSSLSPLESSNPSLWI